MATILPVAPITNYTPKVDNKWTGNSIKVSCWLVKKRRIGILYTDIWMLEQVYAGCETSSLWGRNVGSWFLRTKLYIF